MKPKPVVSKDGKSVTVRVPLTFRQQGGRKLIVVPGGAEPMRPPPNAYERDAMVKALARAFRWRRLLESGGYASIGDLAEAQGVNFSYMCRVLQADVALAEDRGIDPRWPGRP